jgi:hypothetical protein
VLVVGGGTQVEELVLWLERERWKFGVCCSWLVLVSGQGWAGLGGLDGWALGAGQKCLNLTRGAWSS